MEDKFSISVKLTLDDFLRYHRHALFGGFRGKVTVFFLAVIILGFVGSLLSSETPFILITNSLIPLLVISVLYFIVYRRIVKSFKSDSRLHETFTYEMDRKWLNISGESFQTQMTWDKIHKVVELKPFFLIYQNKFVVSIIPKREITLEEIDSFRTFIHSIPDLKKNLLKQ